MTAISSTPSGLFDYLEHDFARALTQALFRMIAPGGRLLIANFTPDTRDAAFMEAFMDWRLVYCDEDAMRALTDSIATTEIDALEQFRETTATSPTSAWYGDDRRLGITKAHGAARRCLAGPAPQPSTLFGIAFTAADYLLFSVGAATFCASHRPGLSFT